MSLPGDFPKYEINTFEEAERIINELHLRIIALETLPRWLRWLDRKAMM